jgi:hypothetical protein
MHANHLMLKQLDKNNKKSFIKSDDGDEIAKFNSHLEQRNFNRNSNFAAYIFYVSIFFFKKNQIKPNKNLRSEYFIDKIKIIPNSGILTLEPENNLKSY